MIRESKDFQKYESRKKPINIEFKAERCFDFIRYQDMPLSTIINKGINFKHWKIVHNDSEYGSDWDTIEYASVVFQNEDKTIMNLRYLTTYDSDDGNFELDSDINVTIEHKSSLSVIKKEYAKEQKIFNGIKDILINYYGFSESDNCNCCDYDDIYADKYKQVTLIKKFNDKQKIGEVKQIINDANKYAEESMKMLKKGYTNKKLSFTPKGAKGSIKLKYKIQ